MLRKAEQPLVDCRKEGWERKRKGVKQMVNLVQNEVCLRGELHCADPITICKLFYKT